MVILHGVLRVSQETHLDPFNPPGSFEVDFRAPDGKLYHLSLSLHLAAQTINGLMTQSAAEAIKIHLNQKPLVKVRSQPRMEVELSALIG